jgi:hypothetical protein
MPIYNTRDLLPFVNQLEVSILAMNDSISQWDSNKNKLISSIAKTDSTYVTAMSALVRADEAMAEIGTATFKSTAQRGKRLEDTLNNLRAEMYEIAEMVGGNGGGGSLTEGMFFDELNNAIASVDVTIEDGLKLDYRLRELQDMALTGGDLASKNVHMPYKFEVSEPAMQMVIPEDSEIIFVEGEVTVLNAEGDPFLDEHLKIITGTIDGFGNVTLSALPPEPHIMYFPVKMNLKDIPEDFLYLFLQQIIQKNSRVMEVVLGFEKQLGLILDDIQLMKGTQWTPDYSIMRNHQDVVKEGITPKGLNVQVIDGMAHLTFSHNDHPHLSHFVVEKWDEETKRFVPYDGINGIVQK